MSMTDIDFLESIKSAYSVTEHKYIRLVINYYTQFVWAMFYKFCMQIEVADLLCNHIVSVFEWLKAIYSDNSSHFTEKNIKAIFKVHRVTHMTASVTHLFSVDLIEWNVQLILSQLWANCISAETLNVWSQYILKITLSINTQLIQIHEYSSAELLLRYKSQLTHFDTHSLKLPIWTDEMKVKVNKAHDLYVTIKEKNWEITTNQLVLP